MSFLFDGKGFEFEHLQRLQQLGAQNKTNQLLQEQARAAEAEKKLPQCPHCGGRLPGRFNLCKNCGETVHWGHPNTRDPFRRSADAENNRASVERKLREEAEAQAQHQASVEAELREIRDRQGFVVRLQTEYPAIAGLGVLASIAVFANEAWRMSQWARDTDLSAYDGFWDAVQQYSQADPGSAARAWQAIALAVFFSYLGSSVVAKSHRFAVALGFGAATGGMMFYGMPIWVWMFPAVVTVSELLSKGGILGVISANEQVYRQVYAVAGGKASALAGGISALLKAQAEDEYVGNATQPDLWYVRKGGDGGQIRRVTRSDLVAAARAGKLKANYELSRSPTGPFRPVSAAEFKAG
jgi:hypothetical protein